MRRLAVLLVTVLAIGVLIAGIAPQNTVAQCGPAGANGEPCAESVRPDLM